MRIRPIYAAASAGVAAAVLLISGCSSGSAAAPSSGGTTGGGGSAAGPQGNGTTITVWAMDGDYTQDTLDAINAKFTATTGAKADVQVQSWDGITTKITTALATSTPPDVLDIGNTQVASFAETGGLLELTDKATDLQAGQSWLPGLSDPATIDGKLYAVPGFGGTRAVIYNKSTWAQAGITTPPASWAELTTDLGKLKAANTAADYSALYLPGQDWYVGLQFVWDAGGEIASEADGKWTSTLGSDKAQAGLTAFKEFQNTYSTEASRTLFTDQPPQEQVFADGKASAIIAGNGSIGIIKKDNPKLTDTDLGTFALPGKDGGTQPSMLGGSDWGIAARSKNADLATEWVKIAASPEIQNKYVFGKNGWIPNSTEGINAATPSLTDVQKGFFAAALKSKATPASANWAQIEGNKSINQLFSDISSGSKSVPDAATAYDGSATPILQATS